MSKFLNLNANDLLKGVVVTIIAILTRGIYQITDSGSVPTTDQLSAIGWAALTAGVSYLLKNFLTNSNGDFLTREKEVDSQ